MELGEKLLRARQEAGLSQRQLCGEVITRNMLSQIEHGAARPSMDTLRYLAGRLGKPVSFFLEEDAVTLPNRDVIFRARQALDAGNPEEALVALADYRGPDEIFDRERQVLHWQACLAASEQALEEGRERYAAQLLERAGELPTPGLDGMERRRLLLLARVKGQGLGEVVAQLPPLDEELMLRGRDALARGNEDRAGALLDAVEDQQSPEWALLRGRVWLGLGSWEKAAECLLQAEQRYPDEAVPMLERCYRELGDYKSAYEYACRQKR